MPDSSSTVRFWLLNALVWVLYGVAGIGLRQAYFSDAGSAGVLITLGLALALFGCSGAIRALALRADWWARGTAGLLLRLALSVALPAGHDPRSTAAGRAGALGRSQRPPDHR
ncbi:hypothetical protein AB1A87_03600 [Stenotrophomonas maltophilia]|uniref:hypothetical protein n=1 Tax=Stenotrophomonas maltophilia TaxID=40324 RepID=UPI003452572C